MEVDGQVVRLIPQTLGVPYTYNSSHFKSDDEPLRGVAQEFDFGSNEEESEPKPGPQAVSRKKFKQTERPKKIIPTASDASSSEDDDDEPVTMANMAARSRELDALAAVEAEMDAEALQRVVENDEDEDDITTDCEEDADGDIDAEPFHLPTPKGMKKKQKESQMFMPSKGACIIVFEFSQNSTDVLRKAGECSSFWI